MNRILPLACWLLWSSAVLATSATGQVVFPRGVPSVDDFDGAMAAPFGTSESRLQQFWDPFEFGSGPQFASRLSFRLDGPSTGAAGIVIARRLTVDLGTTDVPFEQLGSEFGRNLSAPLTRVLDGMPIAFQADTRPSAAAEPFDLVVPLSTPVLLSIPVSSVGAVVMDIRSQDVVLPAGAQAMIDVFDDPANAGDSGSIQSNGFSCVAPDFSIPYLEAAGDPEPGGVLSVSGSEFEPGSFVVPLITAAEFDERLDLPFGRGCGLWVNPMTGFFGGAALVDTTGVFPGFRLPIPRIRIGVPPPIVYVQAVTVSFPSGEIGTTNYQTIRVGAPKTGVRSGGWTVVNQSSATAAFGESVGHGSVAVLIE